MLDRQYLQELAAKERDAYRSAGPFPHTVIDGFLPQEVAESVLAEFPGPGDTEWWSFDDARERKLATLDDRSMGPVTRQLLWELNSAAAIDFLSTLTGIDGLVPDPHYFGGGLHQIEPGGYLKVHADFDKHPLTGLERRLNLLIYLNEDWPPDYGGELQLWDPEMTACARSVAPLFNRCVIFTIGEHAYHGHPDPLTCPPGRTRKSLALYYYSRPEPADGIRRGRNTVFRERPGEALPPPVAPTDSAVRFPAALRQQLEAGVKRAARAARSRNRRS